MSYFYYKLERRGGNLLFYILDSNNLKVFIILTLLCEMVILGN